MSVIRRFGEETDIGGGRENQDSWLIWDKHSDVSVYVVLDGHGREVGKVAAECAKEALFSYFDDSYDSLSSNDRETVVQVLVKAHDIAHEAIRKGFQVHLTSKGFEVKENESAGNLSNTSNNNTGSYGSYLTKKQIRNSSMGGLGMNSFLNDSFTCVHGGSSCSIVAIVGHMCYIANVGDSSGLICTPHAVLTRNDIVPIVDSSYEEMNSEFNNVSLQSGNVKQAASISNTSGFNGNTSLESTSTSSSRDATTSASQQGEAQGKEEGKEGAVSSEDISVFTNNMNETSMNSTLDSSSLGDSDNANNSNNVSKSKVSHSMYESHFGVNCITRAVNPSIGDTVSELTDTLVITAEHSPESLYEYVRLINFRPSEVDATLPALNVVYDSPSSDKTRCTPVFKVNESNDIYITNNGKYYKNVRREWASLVSTPRSAHFQDALAFTRSLGDLHLHTYGVTHKPEVQCVDLKAIFDKQRSFYLDSLQKGSSNGTSVQDQSVADGGKEKSTVSDGNNNKEGMAVDGSEDEAEDNSKIGCIVLCTDGVWDNWTYPDVQKFFMHQSCINLVKNEVHGAQSVCHHFMERNKIFAKRNFGDQADNATGVVIYFTFDPEVFSGNSFNGKAYSSGDGNMAIDEATEGVAGSKDNDGNNGAESGNRGRKRSADDSPNR